MKILILESRGDEVVAQVIGDPPEVGRYYFLEDATSGSNAQNRLFHLLVRIYHDSRCHSYPTPVSYWDFRQKIKRDIGVGFRSFIYVSDDGKIAECTSTGEIPEHIRRDRERVRGRLKDWRDYTMKERRQTIDSLIKEMIEAEVKDPDFESILRDDFSE